MTPRDAMLLGGLQGATEFLPVSSSGHLRLAELYLGGLSENLALEVALHLGTILAVLVYYRKEVVGLCGALAPGGEDGARRLLGHILLASIPTALLGLGMKKAGVEDLGRVAVGLGLLSTSILNLSTRFTTGGESVLDAGRALLIGIAQGVAVLPGVSRSGSTIAVGMALGLPGVEAARFSFLASIPAVLGANLLVAIEALEQGGSSLDPLSLALGIIVSFLVGYLCLTFLIRQLGRGSFVLWSVYCLVLGLAVLGPVVVPGTGAP